MSTPTIISRVTSQDGTLWEVEGSHDTVHIVAYDWDGWMCTCEDHFYRHSFCKHMKVCAESESISSQKLFVDGANYGC